MRKIGSEFLGTAILLASIVGSGIMAENLSQDVGIQLIINAISTVCALFVLINLFGSISGAHFNPIVTIYRRFEGRISTKTLIAYVVAQIFGGSVGVLTANVMFGLSPVEISEKVRSGLGHFLGEILATAGLLTILALKSEQASQLVPLWIGSAFFFTASTSFANPAVTLARTLSNTFTGISPSSIALFILAQSCALLLVLGFTRVLNDIKRSVK